jgi:hypothetical protein
VDLSTICTQHHILARATLSKFRRRTQQWEVFTTKSDRFSKPPRWLGLRKRSQRRSDGLESAGVMTAQCEFHASVRTEDIDCQRKIAALHLLEQQRLATKISMTGVESRCRRTLQCAGGFAVAVSHFGNLQNWGDFARHAYKLTNLIEVAEQRTEIWEY